MFDKEILECDRRINYPKWKMEKEEHEEATTIPYSVAQR